MGIYQKIIFQKKEPAREPIRQDWEGDTPPSRADFFV